ncbi:MAG: alpha/beta fold hydrolase, partial [Actinobacteria bacterium]|nr:alpha/beta fold hydrolase [Actinomycetota bacterium]
MGSHLDGLSMVDVGGHATRVLDVGVGDPVVLLHGWGGRIESMAPVARCLEDSVRVLALDLPGFGESPAPTEVWGSPEYGVFVARLLRDRGIERAHMVGHSFGAKTALQIAASRPQLVDRLVIVGASGLRTAPSWRARAKRALSRG